MSTTNNPIKKEWTDTLLNWAAKGFGLILVVLVVQMLLNAVGGNAGVAFTMQVWPLPTTLMAWVDLAISAMALGASGAYIFKFVDDNIGKSRHGSAHLHIPHTTRRAISKNATAIIIVLIIVGAALYYSQKANVGLTPSGTYSYQAPIALAVADGLAGGADSPSSVGVYATPTSPSIDTITISSGKGTSGLSTYTSGQTYWIRIYDATTKVLSWQQISIPYSSSITAPSSWPIALTVENPPATATLSASINGTSEATGALYNVTGQGNLVPTLRISVLNPTDNKGLTPTPGPDLGITQWELGAFVLLGNESAAKVSISGPTFLTRLSSTDVRYYQSLPSGSNAWNNAMGSFDRMKDANGIYKGSGGMVTFNVNLNCQGLAVGNNATLTVYVYAYTSSQYYMSNGFLYGPTAVSLGTYVLNFNA
jgi:hypothetical protein